MSAGTVIDVQEVVAGSELVSNTSIGAGTLTVVDPTDFTTDGGAILVDTEAISYSTVDEVTGIVTLVGTLTAAHLAGDRVTIVPATVERYAHVSLEGQEEVLEARVPHALYDRLKVGIRDSSSYEMELVELSRSAEGDLIVGDVIAREPVVDGSFIDTTTLPPNPSDGLPPSASPTPTVSGGIGSIAIQWTAIANADPPSYDVHVSTSSGFTPGPTTYAGTTDGTLLVVHRLPVDGSPLDPSVTYFVKLVATDVDGSAAAGAQASGSPRQVTTGDVAAESITGNEIQGNTITGEKIAAVLLLASVMQTASEGQRVELSPAGIKLYASDNSELVDIPTDPDKSPTFRGDVVTGALTVLGNMVMQGATNVMDKGAALTLLGKLGDPSNAPTVGFEYDSDPLPAPMGDETQIIGLDFDTNGNATTTDTFLMLGYGKDANVNLYEVAAVRPVTLLRSAALFPLSNVHNGVDIYGVARQGGYIWVLYKSSAASNIVLRAFDAATLAGAGSTTLSLTLTSDQGLGLGSDGTNLLIVGWSSASNGADKKVYPVSISGATPTVGAPFNLTGGKTRATTTGLGGITGRDGTHYTTVTKGQTGGKNYSIFENFLQSTKALDTADGSVWTPDSVTPSSNPVAELWKGVAYDGTQYIGVGNFSAILQRYSSWVWTPGSNGDKWWIGYTWAHSGPLETGVSPRTSIILNGGSGGIGRLASSTFVAMRGQLKVTIPQLPGDADSANVYELPSSTAPATTAMHKQTPAITVYGTPSGFFVVRAYSAAGAAPDTAHPFPGGNATIQGDLTAAGVTGIWKLNSDGSTVLTRSTVAQRPGAPTKADFRFNEDDSTLEYYDGSTWRQASVRVVSVAVNIASTAAHSSGNTTVTISGLRVGDLCFHLGVDTADGIQFHFRTESACSTAGQILLRYFNADSATVDPASATHRFLIVRLT